jgi:Domain of unknown function (DUF4249)
MVASPRRGVRAGLVALLALAAISCNFEDVVAPGKKVVVVHAVLDLGATAQFVIVRYSDVDGDGKPISNAQVSIITPEGVSMIATQDTATTYECDSRGCSARLETVAYRITPSAFGVLLAPGGTYTLHVHTPANEDVTGSTTVPAASPVVSDTSEVPFARIRDTLKMGWPAVTGAAAYELRTTSTVSFSSGAHYVVFTSNPAAVAGTLHSLDGNEEIFAAGDHVTVQVSAVDANYYEYYRVLEDPFRGIAPGHLTGGLGVFGSLVPVAGRRLKVH